MKNIENIIQEIFELDPKLRTHEVEVRRVIEILLQNMPEPVINEVFIAELRAKLQSSSISVSQSENSRGGNFFSGLFSKPSRVSYALAGVAGMAVLLLLVVPFVKMSPISNLRNVATNLQRPSIVALAPSAFGKLAMNGGTQTQSASGVESDRAEAPLGSPAAISARPQSGGGGSATDSAMRIWPNFPPVALKFAGEPIEFQENAMAVYRRLIDRNVASQFASAFTKLPNGLIDLAGQGNLQLLNVQLVSPGSEGMSYNFDLREGRLYINQYFEGLVMPDRQASEDDILPENELVDIANSFLRDSGIDMNSYGQGVVDQQWRGPYLMEKANGNAATAYVPSIMNVTYPLIVDGNKIYDMSGNPSGISVQVNIFSRRVVGAGNISVLNFEKSDYTIETDFSRIVAMAEKGGMYGFWYPSENIKELELGTPEIIYTLYYQYDEATGQNKELYVPALKFPIINAPKDSYYGPQNIVVPIVKDILDAQQKILNDVMPIEPGPATKPAPAPMPLDLGTSKEMMVR
jgi:hypothetical protein